MADKQPTDLRKLWLSQKFKKVEKKEGQQAAEESFSDDIPEFHEDCDACEQEESLKDDDCRTCEDE